MADGERLTGQFKLIEPRLRKDRKSPFAGMINPYTRQRVPEAPQDKRVLYAEIEFPFTGKPDEIVIVPPVDGEGRALVSIGFHRVSQVGPGNRFSIPRCPGCIESRLEGPLVLQI